jgi:hypothetical protein
MGSRSVPLIDGLPSFEQIYCRARKNLAGADRARVVVHQRGGLYSSRYEAPISRHDKVVFVRLRGIHKVWVYSKARDEARGLDRATEG